MRKLIIGALLGALLLTIALPGIALADPGDGLDVDIVVVGDDADVDVDIHGDNANVSVNGDGLATADDVVATVDAARPRGSRGDLITWMAARRADKWIREIGQYLPDAVAILILESGEHDGQLVVNTIMLQDHDFAISSNKHNIESIWRAVGTLDTRTQDANESIISLKQFQLDMERRWWISTVVATGLLTVILVVGISVWMRKY